MRTLLTWTAAIGLIVCAYSTGASNEDDAFTIGVQAFIWGFPIWYAERSRMAIVTVPVPGQGGAPTNTFFHADRLAGPDDKQVQSPNTDTLYSAAWLDVSREPVVLTIPDLKGRFYTVQFIDAYTNNFFYASERVTGFRKQVYTIVGPSWSGKLPPAVEKITAPTPTVFVIGRILVDGPGDIAAARTYQEQMSLVPLSQRGKALPPAKPDPAPPTYQGPLAFFEELGELISRNRPPLHDAGLMGIFKRIGLSPDTGFDLSALDEATKRGLERAIPIAKTIIEEKAKAMGSSQNGWQLAPIAERYFGTDYLFRAAMAWQSIFVNDPAEAYYPAVYVDDQGEPLDGAKQRYVLKFPQGATPPVGAFWSVTMYDLKHRLLVANPINRYAIGDRTQGLKHDADGSLSIYIQHSSPGADKESNWLPAPSEPFYMLLRMYLPKMAVLNGQYELPPVRRVP